jgi:hypothetical protein
MLYAEQKAHELRREIAVTDDCLAAVRPLVGRAGLPAETTAVYRELLAESMRLCGELEANEHAILSGVDARACGRA